MKADIIANLTLLAPEVVIEEMFDSFERMVAKHRAGDAEGCLVVAGKFVEHLCRALEFKRTGVLPSEIKSPKATLDLFKKDTSLPESLQTLVPGVAYGMIYDIRSKRGAVHVKQINPKRIDAALAVTAASWIIAELIRLYHVSSDDAVAREMEALTRAVMPFVEVVAGSMIVTAKVPGDIEMLLLLGNAMPAGLSRKQLGQSAKCSPASVTRSLQNLQSDRFVHKADDGVYHITGSGERKLAQYVSASASA